MIEELTPTRDELRAVLASPTSSKKQVVEAKLVQGRRIADGTQRIRQICNEYRLTPEQTEEMMASHQRLTGRVEAKAAQEVQRLEEALTKLNKE